MPDFSTEVVQLIATGTLAVAATTAVATVEVPLNGDITDITGEIITTPTGSGVVLFDILRTPQASAATTAPGLGTSVFAAAIATVAAAPVGPQYAAGGGHVTQTGGGIAIGDTLIYLEFPNNVGPDIQVGQLLTIDSEVFTVTGPIVGSAKVDNEKPVYGVPVSRGSVGTAGTATTAAVHANGTSVFPTKPFIIPTQFRSSISVSPALSQALPELFEGDVLALVILGVGGTIAGANLTVSVEIGER